MEVFFVASDGAVVGQEACDRDDPRERRRISHRQAAVLVIADGRGELRRELPGLENGPAEPRMPGR